MKKQLFSIVAIISFSLGVLGSLNAADRRYYPGYNEKRWQRLQAKNYKKRIEDAITQIRLLQERNEKLEQTKPHKYKHEIEVNKSRIAVLMKML